MAEEIRGNRRSQLGYGSSYQKGNWQSPLHNRGIDTVLGGQVWNVKPDKKSKASNPCLWMMAGAVKAKSCNNFYDCTTCKYDFAMNKKVQEGKQ